MRQNFFSDKRVLVTGHTGFKGSWLTLWLAELGAKVTGVALDPISNSCAFNAMQLAERCNDIRQDINDFKTLQQRFFECQPEIVFHLAAQPLVLQSYKEPLNTFSTNIIGTANVLEACRNTDSIKAIIIITTDKCYENNEWVYGYRETDRLGGKDPYSASKAAAEIVVNAYRQSFFSSSNSPAVATVRAGNVIGGGDWAENRIVPDSIKALSDNRSITIRNPNAVRPWQHVLEPLDGYLLLAERMVSNPTRFSQPWNFGPANEGVKPVQLLVEDIIKCWGSGSLVICPDQNKPHEAGLLTLDISKARNILEWNPKLTFEDSVSMTVEWYVAQSKGANMVDFSTAQIKRYESKQI